MTEITVEQLLVLLRDSDVKTAIRQIMDDEIDEPTLVPEVEAVVERAPSVEVMSIVSLEQSNQLLALQQQIEELNQMIAKLKQWLGLAENKNQQLSKQVQLHQDENVQQQRHYEDEKQQLQAQLEVAQQQQRQQQDALTDLEQRLVWYRDNFDHEVRLYETYQGLSDSTKSSLSGIFKDVSIQGLIACGVQENNIANLWEYIKVQTVEGNNTDLPKLHDLFDKLFAHFVLAYPMYQRAAGETGTAFDVQLHIKHHNSATTSGLIQQVVLSGYRNSRTGKVIKPSVILL